MRLTLRLRDPKTGHAALMALWSQAKPLLQQGRELVLVLKPQTRSDAQNRLLHAALADVARQCEWAGRKWDIEDWKRLMTAAWCRATSQGAQMVPSLDGHGFDVLYRRTSKLTVGECGELLEYVFAWGAENGVKFSAPEYDSR